MVANSRRVIALIDASKLERTALSFFAPVTAIDVLVTDAGADPRVVAQLRESGLEVHVAPVAP
jgi:DeoR family fructose operon transcriptional repressor